MNGVIPLKERTMKKLLSLAVLSALVAGCMDGGSEYAGYGYEGMDEEQLATGNANLNSDTYLMAAAPKYYIGSAYKIEDVSYIPVEDLEYNQTGIAGIIPVELNGSKTSDGEVFDSNQLVATSKTLPLPSIVRVTNLDNGNAVTVRVNNRGPFVNTRIMDLSAAAAQQIGLTRQAKVQVQVLGPQSLAVKKATLGETQQPVAEAQPVSVDNTNTQTVAAPKGDYIVQIAAVYSEDNANALVKELTQYGNPVVVHENDMYKVRFVDLDAKKARSIIDALRSDKGMAPGLLKAGKWVNADSI